MSLPWQSMMSLFVIMIRQFYITAIALQVFVQRCYGLNETILRRDISNIMQKINFQMPNMFLEDTVTSQNIQYYLYTRYYRNISIERNLNYINKKYPVKMLIHGWTEHNSVEWYRNTIKAYTKNGWFNVISVDWSSKGDADYVTASRNSKPVGNRIGEYLVRLHDKNGIPYKNMHLISHSLGCHVAGFAGKRVFELTRRKIARISALDPAAPIFDMITIGTNDRLAKGDANFVDVIHTDGGMLGFSYPIGTADFFPNGGTAIQPGCSLLKLDIKYADFFCSHASSHQFFINSINNERKFMAKRCESWDKFTSGSCNDHPLVIYGENSPDTISGNFYFKTKEDDIIVM